MYALRIDSDKLTAHLGGLAEFLRKPERLTRGLGDELRKQLVGHFRTKDRTDKNKLGGTRQHFWREVQQSVSRKVVAGDGLSVTVSVTDERFAQKVYGGEIRAKNKQFLAIPVSKDAYGESPKSLEEEEHIKLFFIRKGPDSALLAAKNGKGKLKIHYLLKRSVFQLPDPTALPDQEALAAAMQAKAQEIVDVKIGGGAVA